MEHGIISGDIHDSFGSIISSLSPLIESRIQRYSIPGFEREDLRQEAYMAVLGAMGSFDASRGAGFQTYAVSCIDNRLADVARKNTSAILLTIEGDDLSEMEEQLADCSTGVEDAVIAQTELFEVLERIDRLFSQLEKECIYLWISGCKAGEIGKRLGVSARSVTNALNRARKKLK